MFSFDKSDLQRVAVSGVGAIALSAAGLFAAAAPVKAAAPSWPAQVAERVAATNVEDSRFAPATLATADVALHFTAGGDFAGASLARSSGNKVIDDRAVKVADAVRYPRLPLAMRGGARDVTMRLHFGDGANGVVAPEPKGRVEVADAALRGIQVAAR